MTLMTSMTSMPSKNPEKNAAIKIARVLASPEIQTRSRLTLGVDAKKFYLLGGNGQAIA
jgi:hypothetical protein